MKALIQKLPVDNDRSFVCRTYLTPVFETPWHQHIEIELVTILHGHGQALIGDYFGDYTAGDVFLLGSNLPHWFRKADPDVPGGSLVVHFVPEFLGTSFMALPEMLEALRLLDRAAQGFKLLGTLRDEVASAMQQMEHSTQLTPLWLLLQVLDKIARSEELDTLCTSATRHHALPDVGPISRVFEYTLTHFQQPLSIDHMADLVSMSRATFCRRFRQSTKKSFIDFLKEVRIGHACKLLTDSELPVSVVGEQSGYNSLANFNRQFRELKNVSPLQFRMGRKINVT
jgi:AraC-like DNA-binding protein